MSNQDTTEGDCPPTTCSRNRFEQWAGTGWNKMWTEFFGGEDISDMLVWPIIDTRAGHEIDGYPTPEQWFAVAMTAEAQATICRLLNGCANAEADPATGEKL